MNKRILSQVIHILGYLCWALFVNLFYVWILRPLVQDLAVYGVLLAMFTIVVWLTTIPKASRRRWVSFTLMSLLLGDGLSTLAFSSVAKTVVTTCAMAVGLLIIAIWYGRARIVPAAIGALAVVLAQFALPLNDWAFLTHFHVLREGRVHITPQQMQFAPMEIIHTASGDAVITVDGYIPDETAMEELAENAKDSPDALFNIMQAASGAYHIVELKQVGQRIVKTTPSPQDLAKVNPLMLLTSFFPYQQAHFFVRDHQITEYLTPFLADGDAVGIALSPANYPASFPLVANRAASEAVANWNACLGQLGVKPRVQGVELVNDHLTGAIGKTNVSISMQNRSLAGVGHFTSAKAEQALLLGSNSIQVIDLNSGRIAATYKGTLDDVVPNDVKFGPLTTGGKDAIFVNASPAYALTVDSSGTWHKVYTATSPSFRFETVLPGGNGAPQIVTNDPSMLRNTPTRYFSAYHFVGNENSSGSLVRDWRVFRTNVVNVTPIALAPGAAGDLIVGIYGTGEYLILQPSRIPGVQIAVILMGLVFIGGWVFRAIRGKRSDVQ